MRVSRSLSIYKMVKSDLQRLILKSIKYKINELFQFAQNEGFENPEYIQRDHCSIFL